MNLYKNDSFAIAITFLKVLAWDNFHLYNDLNKNRVFLKECINDGII